MRFRALALLVAILFGAAGSDSAQASNQIDTLRGLFAALRFCWTPPAVDHEFAEIAVTVRFSLKSTGELVGPPRITSLTPGLPEATATAYRESVITSFNRCLPLPLSAGLGGAIAGHPIAIRLIDRRQKSRQASRSFHNL
jgi:hypothetical protein